MSFNVPFGFFGFRLYSLWKVVWLKTCLERFMSHHSKFSDSSVPTKSDRVQCSWIITVMIVHFIYLFDQKTNNIYNMNSNCMLSGFNWFSRSEISKYIRYVDRSWKSSIWYFSITKTNNLTKLAHDLLCPGNKLHALWL